MSDLNKAVRESGDGIYLDCWIQPKASRTTISGLHGTSIKITIAAVPENGKANIELCAYLSKMLNISKSSVQIKSGHSSRHKIVFCRNISKNEFCNQLSYF